MASTTSLHNILQSQNLYVIIGKSACGYTQKAKTLLENYTRNANCKYKYIEKDDKLSDEQLSEINRLSNGHKTVPIIFFNGQFVGGYDKLAERIGENS